MKQPSPAFEWTCTELARATALSDLVARGTLRLALKQAGLEPGNVSGVEMGALLRKILPRELKARAIAEPDKVCNELAQRIRTQRFEGDDPVLSVFRRLADV
jgi:hypothetical protein